MSMLLPQNLIVRTNQEKEATMLLLRISQLPVQIQTVPIAVVPTKKATIMEIHQMILQIGITKIEIRTNTKTRTIIIETIVLTHLIQKKKNRKRSLPKAAVKNQTNQGLE